MKTKILPLNMLLLFPLLNIFMSACAQNINYQTPHIIIRAYCINLKNHSCYDACFLPEFREYPKDGIFFSTDAALKDPEEVRILDIRGQDLNSWPAFFHEMKYLEELYISNNQFST